MGMFFCERKHIFFQDVLELSSGHTYLNTLLIIRCNVHRLQSIISLCRHADQKFAAVEGVNYKSELYAFIKTAVQYAHLDYGLFHLLFCVC